MKALLDACVIFPTILREILLDVAQAGVFEPLWSERIIEEWVHSSAKLGPDQKSVAGAEAAFMRLRFPRAMIAPQDEAGLVVDLPDAGDLHVLRAAMDGRAPIIVTLNLRDFPRRILSRFGVQAVHPDEFLTGFMRDHSQVVSAAVATALARAQASGASMSQSDMLARARLPRLNKALIRIAMGPGKSGILEDRLDDSANDG